MVIEEIDQHPPVMAEGWVYPSFAQDKMPVPGAEGIYAAVQLYTPLDANGIATFQSPLDEVAQEISNQEIVVIA